MRRQNIANPIDDSGPILRAIIWSVALNTFVPVLLYELSKRFVSPSEYVALLAATIFPVAESAWGLWRERSMDPIGVIVLLGIIVDAAALTLGGSPRLLLLRESLFTGAFGLACFASLAWHRPLMFYFGRFFMTGNDPVRRARFNQSWSLAEVRRGNRLVTAVWGTVFTSELAIRVTLIYSLRAALVLVLSPLILGLLTVAAIVWSLAYARRMRLRVLTRLSGAALNPSAAQDPLAVV
ncbi:MAG: VC0807 family protein [Terriglobales bacterium]